MANTKHRLRKLREALAKEGIDALMVTNPANRRYLTGFAGSAGYAVVTADRAMLFVDFRYETQAKEQTEGIEVIRHGDSAIRSVAEKLAESGIRTLGFEQRHVTYGDYLKYAEELGKGFSFVPTDGLVERLRQIKDDEELEVLRKAVEIADAAFEHILTVLKPGLSERDVALELEMHMRRLGAKGSSFDIIVASGERSALPHGTASGRIIGKNEFVKMDFGALYDGYCSDLTRTVVVGKPNEKHRELYEIVREAQEKAIAGLRAGLTGKEGDALARNVIEARGYGSHFGHGTGHSVGLDIHESPRLSRLDETVLEPGMVLTVEPGIYVPGFGGVRIEDMVVVRQDGCDVLTRARKDLIAIDS